MAGNGVEAGRMKDRMVLFFLAGSVFMTNPVLASFEIGDVRVQPLGPHLVRIEQRGPAGFEDRETFTVVDRAGAGAAASVARCTRMYRAMPRPATPSWPAKSSSARRWARP